MNEATKQAYLDKSVAQLNEWSAKAAVIKAKLANGAADVRVDYNTQLERWQEKETTFKQKVEELRSAGAEGFESMKSGVQNIWNEITAMVQTLEEKTK